MDDRWRGVQFEVRPDPLHPHRFEVEIWPNELMAGSGPHGQVRAIAGGTVVTLEDQGGLKIIAFHPSEKQFADLQRSDYEEKACDAVWDYVLKNRPERSIGAAHPSLSSRSSRPLDGFSGQPGIR